MLEKADATLLETQAADWPEGDLTRVPYWLFQQESVLDAEQERIFRGPHWHFLCMERELPEAGDFRTTHVGRSPVVVVRDDDGEIYAFENRCAHRGALVCLENGGKASGFSCVYHGWRYSRRGDLEAVPFQEGIDGKGGMAASFCMENHNLRKLRVEVVHHVVFGSFSEEVPPIEEYLGEEIHDRIERVLGRRTPVVLGRFTQILPNNWRLYVENVKDSYHASILHLFFTTFRVNRLSQRGGIIVDESGGNHVSYSAIDRQPRDDRHYSKEELRSNHESYRLADPSMLEGFFDELGDGVTLQILTVFPTFVLQQIMNAISLRQVVPLGVDRTALNWTYLGFEEDTPEERAMRMKQSNLMGPAGFVSMEDGCVGGFVQRGIGGAQTERSVLEMGGTTAESQAGRATETSVRGFWKAYRASMGI